MSNLKRWTASEIEFLKNNYEKMLYSKIAEKLNRSEGSIRAKCHDLGLVQKDAWSEDDVAFLKEHYYAMDNSELSKQLNRTENSIHLKASKLGLKKYPYHCDYDFFHCIDTEEKAYWLGFLTADGWASKNSKTNSGVVGLELQHSDIDHLKKFNKSLHGNYQIIDVWKPCGVIGRDPNKKSHMAMLRIFSTTMCNDLEQYGFLDDKTKNIKMPDLQRELIPHYLRGFFDGDGCFGYTKKSFGVSFLSASSVLIESIKTILDNENITSSIVYFQSEYGTNMCRLYVYRKQDKIKLLDYMYSNANIYLDRKFQKYLQVKKEQDC